MSYILNNLLLFYQQHTRSDNTQLIVAITTDRFYELFSSRLAAAVKEASIISYLSTLFSVLGHICDKPRKNIQGIMYTELDNQWVRTTMLNPSLQKELKTLVVKSIADGLIALFSYHC